MDEKDLIELGIRIEEAMINLQDACVYLKRFEKSVDLAVAELLLENVRALRSRFQSWASEKYELGLNDAVLEAIRKRKE